MHFLFFAAQYLPTVGGVERYTYNLSKTLTEMGHRCTVVTSALPGLSEDETSEGIRVIRLPSYLLMNGRFPVVKRGRAIGKAGQKIWADSYDFAVINTRFYPLSLYAAKQCFKRNIPSLVIEHGTKHLSLDNPILNCFGNLYEHVMMKQIRRFSNRIYGVSSACSDWLSHFHIKADGVLYNSIDSSSVQTVAGRSSFSVRERYQIPESSPLIVFSGRFIREKGIFELLEGFSRYRADHPDAALVMAGEGPLFETVRDKKLPGVFLTGMLPYEDSLALLMSADVFLLPTYSEGFSSVILEAAALGCCIITTPTGGSKELIQTGKSGILIDEISPEHIASALEKSLSDDSFRLAAGKAVQKEVEERFTWKNTADTLVSIAIKQTCKEAL